jgi:hypothetical protein
MKYTTNKYKIENVCIECRSGSLVLDATVVVYAPSEAKAKEFIGRWVNGQAYTATVTINGRWIDINTAFKKGLFSIDWLEQDNTSDFTVTEMEN